MGKRIKVVGEGGAHRHKLAGLQTELDGFHKHLFFVSDRLIMTDLSGAHKHELHPTTSNFTISEPEPIHSHRIQIMTPDGLKELETSPGDSHYHELQSDMTTLSGLHTHIADLGGASFVSILPSDLIEAVEAAAQKTAAFKDFKITIDEESFFEMNFEMIKRLNQPDMAEIMKAAVSVCVLKSLSRLTDSGLFIQSKSIDEHTLEILPVESFREGTIKKITVMNGLSLTAGVLKNEEFVRLGINNGSICNSLPVNAVPVKVITKEQHVPTTMASLQKRLGVKTSAFEEIEKRNIPISKGVKWQSVRLKAVDNTNIVCKFCDGDGMGMGLKCSVCFFCAVDRTEKGVFDDCLAGTFDFDAYADKYPDDIALKAKSDATQKRFGTVEIFKRDDEQRLITGPVLIPETFDLQNDIISSDEIMKAAHGYMIKLCFQNDPDFLVELGLSKRSERGFMHVEFTRKIAVVESYQAPVDFEMNGRAVTKGTWIMTVKVFDDEVWNLVKAGKINGFSIGGRSRAVAA